MELVDMQDLGSCVERRVGSSPFRRTTKETLNVYQAFSVLFMQKLWRFMHFTAKGRQNVPKSS